MRKNTSKYHRNFKHLEQDKKTFVSCLVAPISCSAPLTSARLPVVICSGDLQRPQIRSHLELELQKQPKHLELTNDCPRNETLTGEDEPRSNNRLQVNPPDHGSAIVIDDGLWSPAADGPSYAAWENRPWGQMATVLEYFLNLSIFLPIQWLWSLFRSRQHNYLGIHFFKGFNFIIFTSQRASFGTFRKKKERKLCTWWA